MAWSDAARRAALEARRRKARANPISAKFKQPVVVRDASGKEYKIKGRLGGMLTTSSGRQIRLSRIVQMQSGHLVRTKKGWGYRKTWSKVR